jgi:N-acetylneuraminate synthase
LYAKKNLKKGEKITKKNITIKGPAGGILPKYLDLILNKKIQKKVDKDYPITWDLL